ncbi:colicin D domain-containing protein [Marinobacter sp. LN3S78]|uniref:colicin D domain-containing protein n=1 Tax=Marinobacter sp. LN3S78 TaxID=3382300 RepID=UPI00387AF53D
MFHRDPILVKAPMGRIYAFTRYYRGNNIFDGPHLAFPHDRGFARERLLDLTRHIGDDPFNDRLHDVWQMVFQKPWTRPKSLHELVMDLTDKITRGELFVYEERDPDRSHRIPVPDGPPFVDIGVPETRSPADTPRTKGPAVISSNDQESRDAPLQTTIPENEPEPVESMLDRGRLYHTVGLDTVTARGAGGDTIGGMYDKVYDGDGNQRPGIDNDTANAFDEAYLQAQDISDMRAEGYRMVAEDTAISAVTGPTGLAFSRLRRAAPAFSRVVLATPKQLQKKYLKHAGDFGVHGPYNRVNSQSFNEAIQRHVNHRETLEFPGSYRGNNVIFHTNPNTGLTVIEKREGGFLSGWKLNEKQLKHVLEDQKL